MELSDENRFRTYNVKDLKSAKTYLPEEVIREFKEGFENSAKSPSTVKSRNFVKKLVATLEHKKYQSSGHCTADNEFLAKCYSRPSLSNNFILEDKEKETDEFENLRKPGEKENIFFDSCIQDSSLIADRFLKICSLKNPEDSEKNGIFSTKIDINGSKDLKETEHIYDDPEGFEFRKNLHEIEFKNQSEIKKNDQSKIKNNSLRRSVPMAEKKSFRNVLSSIIGLKNRKSNLPKGKRNLFSNKISLGEEMRLFRRDMMPALLKATRTYKFDSEHQKEELFPTIFTDAIPKSKPIDRNASIHPFYSVKKNVPSSLTTLEEEIFEPKNEGIDNRIQRQEIKSFIISESISSSEKKSPVIYDVPKKVINSVSDPNFAIYENSAIFADNNWSKITKPMTRKNIVCGKKALFIRRRQLETLF